MQGILKLHLVAVCVNRAWTDTVKARSNWTVTVDLLDVQAESCKANAKNVCFQSICFE